MTFEAVKYGDFPIWSTGRTEISVGDQPSPSKINIIALEKSSKKNAYF